MHPTKRAGFLVFIAALAGLVSAVAQPESPVLPGGKPDGSVLLHNQWSIRPAGAQVPLGDFPVNLAVHSSGKYAAILHAGYGPHQIWIVDLDAQKTTAVVPVTETFQGIAFSPDGRTLVCSGGSDPVVRVFAFEAGGLRALPDIPAGSAGDSGVVAGVSFSANGRGLLATRLFENQILRADVASGKLAWVANLGESVSRIPSAAPAPSADENAPNDVIGGRAIIGGGQPLEVAWDPRARRVYSSLWGQSSVAVLDDRDGRVLARWACGLHPNAVLLSPPGGWLARLFSGPRRLYVSNGGTNTVTVIDTSDGRAVETLSSAMSPGDLPGSTPDSLALSADGHTLYVANAYNNAIAVFDVRVAGAARILGFIPTGWFPTAIRLTPDGRRLLFVSARGLEARPNPKGSDGKWPSIHTIYSGSLGIVDLPKAAEFDRTLADWTRAAQRCRPTPEGGAASGTVPALEERAGAPSPIRYVIYVIKENRTYDQVFGDLKQANGDPSLCLFPEQVTPNLHALARQFAIFDNFYDNAEVSASGHEWSMSAYDSEFVERAWPINYGHKSAKTEESKKSNPARENVPYPAEGHYMAALPELGYLWDDAARAGVTYRSYGEFIVNGKTAHDPSVALLPALKDHFDPSFRGFDLDYSDRLRADRFLSELHRYEVEGDMPRLQIVRLPNDHTQGAKAGKLTPRALVADNDAGVGRLIEGISHSRFWPQTAVFIIEDDAQDGPDHVDAHRSTALVISPFIRRGIVDSTPYTTCSMLRTIELILGLKPMSQFDAAARPMWAAFQAQADPSPYAAIPTQWNLEEKNLAHTKAAKVSEAFDFSHEDAVDEQALNRVVWASVRGDDAAMPAPVHAAFVRELQPKRKDDDD